MIPFLEYCHLDFTGLAESFVMTKLSSALGYHIRATSFLLTILQMH